MAEKILRGAPRRRRPEGTSSPATRSSFSVDGGYSHEFTTAQVDYFLEQEYGAGLQGQEPREVRRLRGPPDLRRRASRAWRPSPRRSRRCAGSRRSSRRRRACATTRRRTASRPASATRSRASSSSTRATSSRRRTATRAWAAGTTRSPTASARRSTRSSSTRASRSPRSPSRSASSCTARLRPGVTAKDVILHILATFAKNQDTLDRVMEFGGPGTRGAVDGRARDAREHGDGVRREGGRGRGRRAHGRVDRGAPARRVEATTCAARLVKPDAGATYAGGVHKIDLASIEPMVAHPGDPDRGIPSDPTNGALIRELPVGQDRHRLRRLVHGGQGRRPRHLRRGRGRGGRRGAARRAGGASSSSSSAPRPSRATRSARATSTSSRRPASR